MSGSGRRHRVESHRLRDAHHARGPAAHDFLLAPAGHRARRRIDALNSFDAVHTYATRVDVPAGASRDAAVAQAAHDVLVALFPAQQAGFDAALAATLGRLSADAARGGAQVGAATAKANLELRASDGWTQYLPRNINPDLPGYWQPVLPQNAPAGYTHYPYVLGFIVDSGSRLLVAPPPVMTGAHYAADFNEVKSLGSATKTTELRSRRR